MATEHRPAPRGTERPSERAVPPPPKPGTPEADFLARLNEVYGEEPDPADERVLAGISRAFRRVLEHER